MKYSLMMVIMSDFVYDRLCGVQRFAFVDPETDNTVLDQKPAMRKKYWQKIIYQCCESHTCQNR